MLTLLEDIFFEAGRGSRSLVGLAEVFDFLVDAEVKFKFNVITMVHTSKF